MMENTFIEIAAILFGFLMRLGIPIALTLLLSLFLKWLDRRWQAEAEAAEVIKTAQVEDLMAYRQPCWEIHNCPSKLRNACPAYAQPETPCWELLRTNGNLKAACLTCRVLPSALA